MSVAEFRFHYSIHLPSFFFFLLSFLYHHHPPFPSFHLVHQPTNHHQFGILPALFSLVSLVFTYFLFPPSYFSSIIHLLLSPPSFSSWLLEIITHLARATLSLSPLVSLSSSVNFRPRSTIHLEHNKTW